MRRLLGSVFVAVLFACCVAAQGSPKTLVLDGALLEKQRTEFAAGKSVRGAEFTALIKAADKVLKTGRTYSVTKKTQTPPSGIKNDYMSLGPYWWPDPTKPNGLPYIRRDGERNPDIRNISDDTEYNAMLNDSETLALAYFFTRDEKYAKHGSAVLRAWFLDPKTRMNPNLNFGQGIPGIVSGRGIGMIETRAMYRAIDASILLFTSSSWSNTDHESLKGWFREFLKWAVESPLGKDESDERNNHGTYYDVQVIAYALFTEQPDLARKQFDVTRTRIASQIEPDGSQPHELARTLSWGYTNMNAFGFATLARLGETAGVDLWHYQTKDGRSIRKAIEWIVPFAAGEKEWTYKQIKPRAFDRTIPLLRVAAIKYGNPDFSKIAVRLQEPADKDAFRYLGIF